MQEISDVMEPGCPPEYFNIPIPSGDPWFDPGQSGTITIPYKRSRYQTSNSGYSPNHPREQLNGVTSFIDGSAIYGSDRAWANQLRLSKNSCPQRNSNHIFVNEVKLVTSGKKDSVRLFFTSFSGLNSSIWSTFLKAS